MGMIIYDGLCIYTVLLYFIIIIVNIDQDEMKLVIINTIYLAGKIHCKCNMLLTLTNIKCIS